MPLYQGLRDGIILFVSTMVFICKFSRNMNPGGFGWLFLNFVVSYIMLVWDIWLLNGHADNGIIIILIYRKYYEKQ